MNINHIRNQIKQHYKKQREEHFKQYTKKKNSYWNKYYQDSRWHRLRNAYYEMNPCCEVCARQGIVTPANDVHHLHIWNSGITEEAKWNLLLNPNNLCSCCIHHHKLFHKYMMENNTNNATIEQLLRYEEQQTEYYNLINN